MELFGNRFALFLQIKIFWFWPMVQNVASALEQLGIQAQQVKPRLIEADFHDNGPFKGCVRYIFASLLV